ASASADHAEDGSTIRVEAEGRVEAKPDLVSLNVRVFTEAPKSAEAAEQNAARTQAVLKALRKSLGPEAELSTSGYAVSPRYEQPGPNRSRVLVGYQVRNSVVVRSGDLAGIGKAIDVASAAGANEMDSLRFELKDDSTLQLKALAQATRRARQKAEVIAKSLGTQVKRVVSVEEMGGFAPSYRMQASPMMAKDTTPVAVGQVELTARVAMKVEFEQ
ncbi:MAG: SIMPL domain-containing protein, partial [Myxococcota bacterium]|nr:SIMPL domain-containing protein [Myxococcota bacterium]